MSKTGKKPPKAYNALTAIIEFYDRAKDSEKEHIWLFIEAVAKTGMANMLSPNVQKESDFVPVQTIFIPTKETLKKIITTTKTDPIMGRLMLSQFKVNVIVDYMTLVAQGGMTASDGNKYPQPIKAGKKEGVVEYGKDTYELRAAVTLGTIYITQSSKGIFLPLKISSDFIKSLHRAEMQRQELRAEQRVGGPKELVMFGGKMDPLDFVSSEESEDEIVGGGPQGVSVSLFPRGNPWFNVVTKYEEKYNTEKMWEPLASNLLMFLSTRMTDLPSLATIYTPNPRVLALKMTGLYGNLIDFPDSFPMDFQRSKYWMSNVKVGTAITDFETNYGEKLTALVAGFGDGNPFTGIKNAIESLQDAYTALLEAMKANNGNEISDQLEIIKTSSSEIKNFIKQSTATEAIKKMTNLFTDHMRVIRNKMVDYFESVLGDKFGTPTYEKSLSIMFGTHGTHSLSGISSKKMIDEYLGLSDDIIPNDYSKECGEFSLSMKTSLPSVVFSYFSAPKFRMI